MNYISTLLLFLIILLQACTPVSVATGIGSNVTLLALEDRTLKHSLADINLKTRIIADTTQQDKANLINTNIDVFEGRVLLTGIVPNETIRLNILNKVNEYVEVREVLNEIRINSPLTLEHIAHDEALELELKTRIIFDTSIKSINFTVRVVDNEAFVIGIANSINERKLILNHIKSVKSIRSVIDFISFKDDPERLRWLARNI